MCKKICIYSSFLHPHSILRLWLFSLKYKAYSNITRCTNKIVQNCTFVRSLILYGQIFNRCVITEAINKVLCDVRFKINQAIILHNSQAFVLSWTLFWIYNFSWIPFTDYIYKFFKNMQAFYTTIFFTFGSITSDK